MQRNQILEGSVDSYNTKIEKRDQQYYELIDRLTEVEKELEITKHNNCSLKSQ